MNLFARSRSAFRTLHITSNNFLFLAMTSKKELTKLLAVRWNLLTAEQKQVSSYCKNIFI